MLECGVWFPRTLAVVGAGQGEAGESFMKSVLEMAVPPGIRMAPGRKTLYRNIAASPEGFAAFPDFVTRGSRRYYFIGVHQSADQAIRRLAVVSDDREGLRNNTHDGSTGTKIGVGEIVDTKVRDSAIRTPDNEEDRRSDRNFRAGR